MIGMDIGGASKLKRARQSSGLTCTAYAAEIGISPASLFRFENGHYPVSKPVLLAIDGYLARKETFA